MLKHNISARHRDIGKKNKQEIYKNIQIYKFIS